jgi:hypothetical protein
VVKIDEVVLLWPAGGQTAMIAGDLALARTEHTHHTIQRATTKIMVPAPLLNGRRSSLAGEAERRRTRHTRLGVYGRRFDAIGSLEDARAHREHGGHVGGVDGGLLRRIWGRRPSEG